MAVFSKYDKFTGSGSPNRDSKKRYRLYADGTVVDQSMENNVVGYIEGPDLDIIYYIRGANERQEAIRSHLSLEA